MKILKYTVTFMLGIALTIILLFLEVPFWLIYVSMLFVSLVLFVAPHMYTLYKSNNLKKIERYLEQNKHKPIPAYALAVKSGDHDKIIESVQRILTKHKQASIQEVYKTNLALYERNVSKLEQHAKQISKLPLRTYYIAYAEALKGNFEEARTLTGYLTVDWMHHAIEAIIAQTKGDMHTYRKEADASIEHSRGIQKFMNVYAFKNMENNYTKKS
ncbi:hypothetical protein MHH81_02930 [Psychrobacillus sp. FSL H8-0484]|uniref:hypothetical protein n=1 Tax=Psychrobacillus sp. FSL H8-0484 TaxID=2921390 RepID=UPI0030FC2BC8